MISSSTVRPPGALAAGRLLYRRTCLRALVRGDLATAAYPTRMVWRRTALAQAVAEGCFLSALQWMVEQGAPAGPQEVRQALEGAKRAEVREWLVSLMPAKGGGAGYWWGVHCGRSRGREGRAHVLKHTGVHGCAEGHCIVPRLQSACSLWEVFVLQIMLSYGLRTPLRHCTISGGCRWHGGVSTSQVAPCVLVLQYCPKAAGSTGCALGGHSAGRLLLAAFPARVDFLGEGKIPLSYASGHVIGWAVGK